MKPKVLLQTSSIETAIRLSAANMGFSFVPESSVRFSSMVNPPKYYTFGNTETSWTLVIAYRQNAYRSKAVTAFAEIAKKLYHDRRKLCLQYLILNLIKLFQ